MRTFRSILKQFFPPADGAFTAGLEPLKTCCQSITIEEEEEEEKSKYSKIETFFENYSKIERIECFNVNKTQHLRYPNACSVK